MEIKTGLTGGPNKIDTRWKVKPILQIIDRKLN
jgi:hypothetical protein